MSETSQRSFVMCGWAFDKEAGINELSRIVDGDEEMIDNAVVGGYVTNACIGDGTKELKVIDTYGKIILGRLITCGFGTTLPYSIVAFDRLCNDMDEIIKNFDIDTSSLGMPSIHTGMTETVMLGMDDN